ncbi:MAG: LysR family transcriptional regulator [Geminicoccaceae bacterium]|nr:LysR family transcriptional regulator [Geminicoccaceae bacterium]
MRNDPGRLTLRAIEVFIAVVECGALASAAKRLGASPSSASQQLANLEGAVGARLIDRAARPLALTPAGHVFHRRALAIRDEAVRARSELAELELASLPQLRLAVLEDFDADVTPDLVLDLAAALPGCTVVAHAGPSHQILAALDSRAEDVVVAAAVETPPDWVEQHPLLRDPYVLVTAKPLAEAGTDRLLEAPMVRYAATQVMGRQIEAHLRRLRLAPPRRFAFDSNHAVMAMVAKAGGWAITTPLGYLRAPRFHAALDVRPLPFSGFSRTIALHARRGELGGLPGRAAALMRLGIGTHCLPAAARAAPWLEGAFRVLGEE